MPIPPSVFAMTEEFANIAERQKTSGVLDPLFVPYAEGVNDLIIRITKVWGACRDENWLEDGIFKTALGYLEARRKDLESGYCSPHAFSGRSSLVKVLQ